MNDILDGIPAGSGAWIELTFVADGLKPSMVQVYACRGATAGPTALVTAGIHGDEYEGPAAVMRLAATLRPEELTGTVLLAPVANPLAYAAGTRCTPADGVNLARVFPGRAEGSPTERLADLLWRCLAEHADYLIDLHSGGMEYDFLPVAGFFGSPSDENASYRGARAMGLDALWMLPGREGVLSTEFTARGKVAVGAEYRGCGQLWESGADAYAQSVRGCLAEWGLLANSSLETVPPAPIYRTSWLLAPATGLYRTSLRLGDAVREGEEICRIEGSRGELLGRVTADRDGTVLVLRHKAMVGAGDWATLLGTEVECKG